MKKAILLILVGLILAGCNNDLSSPSAEEADKLPYDYMFRQRAYPTGWIKPDASKEAIAFKQRMAPSRAKSQSVAWEFAGPENIGGRITDIEIPVDEADVYLVGTASGGIFKTTNGGDDWNPIFDDFASLSIGDIEISKTNTNLVWVGTGEVNAGGGSLAYDGSGVYRSTNGGDSWENQGLEDVGSISKIIIDPNDDNTVYAGAMGALFKNDSNRGVYKTTNGGADWEQILFISDSTGVIDMVSHPTDSDVLYVATWERIRRPQYRVYGGATSGIYRTSDGGTTWNELTSGLPTAPGDKGRISIAISESNPQVLYARYANAGGSVEGVFRTSNGGDSWVEVNSSQLTNVGFHWWFRGLYVDPADENTLYNVDFVVEKSTNGGNSWFTAFPNVHVDQHALAFNRLRDNEVLLGNDGGFYKSLDDGASSEKSLNLPITQFYRFYVDPQNPDKVYGGSQDNSTMRTTTGSLDDWEIIYGGDGFQPLVSANNTNVIYALSQRGFLGKSINNGNTFRSAIGGIDGNDRNNWDTPVTFDPQNSETLFYGTQRVWKTTNATGSWAPISPDLTNGSGGGNLSYGTITSIDVSPVNSDIIIAGTDDANISITQDGGATWNNISGTLPNLWTTKVLADRADPNALYVTFSGYRYGSNTGHVFKSDDAGLSWLDIGSNLPDIPINDIVKDANGNLYLASDVGVFASNDDGTNWVPFGDGMPSVVVTDLHIQETEELLYAATYGRSAYKIDISEDPLSTTPGSLVDLVSVYPNPASQQVTIALTEPFVKADVVIYDNLGRLAYRGVITPENNVVAVGQLPRGIYYLNVFNAGNKATQKLILE